MGAKPNVKLRRRGFTLVEIVLALGLIVLIAAMMFQFYAMILDLRDRGKGRVESGYLAQTIAHQIAEEVRACNGFLTQMGPGISGTDRFISIQFVRIPDKKVYRNLSVTEDLPPAECDIRQVQYYLAYEQDGEELCDYEDYGVQQAPCNLGLVRREVKTPLQTAFLDSDDRSVALDLISRDIQYIRFRYFDGVDWLRDWDLGEDARNANSLPQAVEITVGYGSLPPPEETDDEEEEADSEAGSGDFTDTDLTPAPPEPYSPDKYTVTVRLQQADSFFGSRLIRAQRSTSGSGGGF